MNVANRSRVLIRSGLVPPTAEHPVDTQRLQARGPDRPPRGAGHGDLAEQTGRRHLITDEIDVIPPIDGGAVPPGRPVPEAGKAIVDQSLHAPDGYRSAVVRPQWHLDLNEGLASRREAGIGKAEALKPAAIVQVADHEGVPP